MKKEAWKEKLSNHLWAKAISSIYNLELREVNIFTLSTPTENLKKGVKMKIYSPQNHKMTWYPVVLWIMHFLQKHKGWELPQEKQK